MLMRKIKLMGGDVKYLMLFQQEDQMMIVID